MNILLVNPPCRAPFMVPVGIGYIASAARESGHNIRVLDINAFEYSFKEVEQIIKDSEFDLVGIGGLTSTYKYVKWLSGVIKKHKPHIPVVAGNMVATTSPGILLKNTKVDIAVIDEGEITFKELLSAISSGEALRGVKGIVYKDNIGNVINTPPQERIHDLDSLPFPAWDLLPMEIYLDNSARCPENFGLRAAMVSAVRGCPYECIFCSRPFGRIVYARSAESVINEIKELKKRYNVKCIYFSDDLMLSNKKFILEFCERIISENVQWSITGRVNLVDNEILTKLHKAGCSAVGYGFESGSQAVLDMMKKRVTVKQAEEAIKMTRKAGMKVISSFIFGMPGETHETIKETLAFIKKTRLPNYRFFYATPYPSTELYEIAKRMGRLPADEDKYLENLGEMWKTFLVNFTDFSDAELVRLKNSAEQIAKRNLNLKIRLEIFMETWHRRYIILSQSLKKVGVMQTAKRIIAKVICRIFDSTGYEQRKKGF